MAEKIERVAIFVDGSNLYHGLKQLLGRADINFEKFSKFLVGDRKLIRLYYYNAPLDQTDAPEAYKKQQKFFEALRKTPYVSVTLGRLAKRDDAYIEKGVDINIAVDMLKLAYNNVYDTAILVSGDADFVSAVVAVKELGKHVELVTTPHGRSNQLMEACDKSTLLTKEMFAALFRTEKK